MSSGSSRPPRATRSASAPTCRSCWSSAPGEVRIGCEVRRGGAARRRGGADAMRLLPDERPRDRIEVMHGVNLDQLGRRDPLLYGTLTLAELERRSTRARASSAWRRASFRPTTRARSSSACTRLRGERGRDPPEPGAWTHYAWAIRDALEIAGAAGARDPSLRRAGARAVAAGVGDRRAVLRDDLRRGPDGYRDALGALREELDCGAARELRRGVTAGSERRGGSRPRCASGRSTCCSSTRWSTCAT